MRRTRGLRGYGLVFLLAACYPIRCHYAAIRAMKEAMVGRE